MKKLAMVMVMCVALLSAAAACWATDLIEASSRVPVSADNTVLTYVYESDVSLDNSGPVTYRINTPAVAGHILEIGWSSGSPDCNVYIMEKDAVLPASVYSRLNMEGINLHYSPELAVPRYFRNRATPAVAELYVQIDNQSATETGDWVLTITYGR